MNYTAYTPCFRSEAGSSGRDTYQQADGSVVVSKVLRPYMGMDIIKK